MTRALVWGKWLAAGFLAHALWPHIMRRDGLWFLVLLAAIAYVVKVITGGDLVERAVRAALGQTCLACHEAPAIEGGLRCATCLACETCTPSAVLAHR